MRSSLKNYLLVMMSALAAIIFFHSPASASEDISELKRRIGLPVCYGASASVRMEGADSAWKTVQFRVSESKLLLVYATPLGDAGSSIFEIRYGDSEESILIRPGSRTAERNSRFNNTLTDAGEIDVTPMSIVRALTQRSDKIELTLVSRDSSLGTVDTYTIRDPEMLGSGVIELDVLGGDLVEYRGNQRGDKFVVTVQYNNWVSVGDGKVPTRIVSRLWDPVSEFTDVSIIAVNDPVPFSESEILPPDIPIGFSVIDHLEGVSMLDGQVIAEIQYDDAPHSTMDLSGALSKLLLWGGVVLVVTAGIALKLRSKAS